MCAWCGVLSPFLCDKACDYGGLTCTCCGILQVEVGGSADSRVARGLVALLSQGLTGAKPEAVLALDPLDVARVRYLHVC